MRRLVGTGNLNGSQHPLIAFFMPTLTLPLAALSWKAPNEGPGRCGIGGVSLLLCGSEIWLGVDMKSNRITSIKLGSGGVSGDLSRGQAINRAQKTWRNKNPLVRCELSAINIALLREQDEHFLNLSPSLSLSWGWGRWGRWAYILSLVPGTEMLKGLW